MVHVLLDELDVSTAVYADAMLFLTHLALLVDDELLGISAVEADELKTALALVDTVELAELGGECISLKGFLQI